VLATSNIVAKAHRKSNAVKIDVQTTQATEQSRALKNSRPTTKTGAHASPLVPQARGVEHLSPVPAVTPDKK
jgi:hypothetical protein